jgi:uncharacterized membrane protein
MRSFSVWKALGLLAMVALAPVLATGCGDAEDDPPDEPAPTGSVTWCEVSGVLARKCRTCHVGEGLNGAPFPLVTYADTQVLLESLDKRRWELMQNMVDQDKMPPEDPKLSESEKELLMTWFGEGAKAVGGTDCQ